jgi:hypothetical protein
MPQTESATHSASVCAVLGVFSPFEPCLAGPYCLGGSRRVTSSGKGERLPIFPHKIKVCYAMRRLFTRSAYHGHTVVTQGAAEPLRGKVETIGNTPSAVHMPQPRESDLCNLFGIRNLKSGTPIELRTGRFPTSFISLAASQSKMAP